MIPEAAVIAAAKVLMADKMSDHSGHNAPEIMDACEKVARKVLEAAAPHMLAQAWDEAHFDGIGCDSTCCDFMHDAPKEDMNPYRPT